MERVPTTILDRFFEDFPPGSALLVLTHDHPDPDSISSAAALAEIASVLGKAKTTVAYGGIIGRSENAHMVRYLGLRMNPVDTIRWSRFPKIALVDTQPRTGNNALPPDRDADLVIDHHPLTRPTRKVRFADIREDYGATATILAEYLFRFGLEIDRNLATALLYGIKSETQDLGREAYEVDINAYMRLFPSANKRLLGRITNSRVPPSYYRWMLNAILNAHIAGNAVVTRVGRVEIPDMIPEIADFMLRMENTAWSLCMGDYDSSIYVSIRTTNPRKDAGKIMKRLVLGKGKGGGHGQIAGGKVPVQDPEPWKIHEMEDRIEGDFLKLIHKADYARIPLLDESGDRARSKAKTSPSASPST